MKDSPRSLARRRVTIKRCVRKYGRAFSEPLPINKRLHMRQFPKAGMSKYR